MRLETIDTRQTAILKVVAVFFVPKSRTFIIFV